MSYCIAYLFLVYLAHGISVTNLARRPFLLLHVVSDGAYFLSSFVLPMPFVSRSCICGLSQYSLFVFLFPIRAYPRIGIFLLYFLSAPLGSYILFFVSYCGARCSVPCIHRDHVLLRADSACSCSISCFFFYRVSMEAYDFCVCDSVFLRCSELAIYVCTPDCHVFLRY